MTTIEILLTVMWITLCVVIFAVYKIRYALAWRRYRNAEKKYIKSLTRKQRKKFYKDREHLNDEKERMYYLTQGYTNW